MCMWPQTINQMFWLFAFKVISERLNTLQLNIYGSTPESIIYGTEVDNIPMKKFHAIFLPVYVLGSRLQEAGGSVPEKWEPRSRKGVYIVHSPFNVGSVVLVFNPLTGRVSPK